MPTKIPIALIDGSMKDEMAQSVECWPSDREIRVQLPAEEQPWASCEPPCAQVNCKPFIPIRVDKLVPASAGGHKPCEHLWG